MLTWIQTVSETKIFYQYCSYFLTSFGFLVKSPLAEREDLNESVERMKKTVAIVKQAQQEVNRDYFTESPNDSTNTS